MSKENKNKNDGQNRCRRCDRPLKNPNDIYGWCCAQIVGANKYDEIASMLDVNAMEMYNRYMVDYLSKDNDGKSRYTNVRSVNGDNSINKVACLPNTDWKTASEIIARNATAQDWHAQSYITKDVWYAPTYGYVEGSREKAIAYRLTNESENVNYVAAYLRYFQDRWKPYYPEIDG